MIHAVSAWRPSAASKPPKKITRPACAENGDTAIVRVPRSARPAGTGSAST